MVMKCSNVIASDIAYSPATGVTGTSLPTTPAANVFASAVALTAGSATSARADAPSPIMPKSNHARMARSVTAVGRLQVFGGADSGDEELP